jgi:hypothetical protein
MKQTAVDLLIEDLQRIMMPEEMADIEWWLFVAKRRERQQISEAYIHGGSDYSVGGWTPDKEDAEHYYQETYGGKDAGLD